MSHAFDPSLKLHNKVKSENVDHNGEIMRKVLNSERGRDKRANALNEFYNV